MVCKFFLTNWSELSIKITTICKINFTNQLLEFVIYQIVCKFFLTNRFELYIEQKPTLVCDSHGTGNKFLNPI